MSQNTEPSSTTIFDEILEDLSLSDQFGSEYKYTAIDETTIQVAHWNEDGTDTTPVAHLSLHLL